MKVKIPLRKANRLINHGPLALISCLIEADRFNCMPVAWIMPVRHEPPMIGAVIGKGNFSHKCIVEHKEFVVNIPPMRIIRQVVECGSVTGAEVNKFEKFNLTPIKAETVKAPLIQECIGHLECEILNDPQLIDNYGLFLANVKIAWVEEEAFDEVWKLDREEFKTIHHLGGNIFSGDGEVKKVF